MKTCKSCKWSKRRWIGPMQCRHPVAGPKMEAPDPVTGRIQGGGYWSCDTNRMHSSTGCGYEGRLWESKPAVPAFTIPSVQ